MARALLDGTGGGRHISLTVVFYGAGTVRFDAAGPADALGAVFIASLFERILAFTEEVSVKVTDVWEWVSLVLVRSMR